MMSPLQKKETGKIKSKEGHMEPMKAETPFLGSDPLKKAVDGEMSGRRNVRSSAMDAAHMRGKQDVTKAANEE